jgi:hypothetical protein
MGHMCFCGAHRPTRLDLVACSSFPAPAVAFAPDGSWLASGGHRTVRWLLCFTPPCSHH